MSCSGRPKHSTRCAGRWCETSCAGPGRRSARRPSRELAGRSGKNYDDLNPAQHATLANIERDNQPLFRAHLLKEELRTVFQEPDPELAKRPLDDWLRWASRSRLRPFVKLARSIRQHRVAIDDVIDHGLSNARLEAAATKLRLLTRLAFGFYSHEPLVALALLRLGGLCPALPLRP